MLEEVVSNNENISPIEVLPGLPVLYDSKGPVTPIYTGSCRVDTPAGAYDYFVKRFREFLEE